MSFCNSGWGPRPDPFSITEFIINLDLAPEDRWNEILTVPIYRATVYEVLDAFLNHAPSEAIQLANELGSDLESYFEQPYAGEIRGIAQNLNISVGLLAVMNIAYEATDA